MTLRYAIFPMLVALSSAAAAVLVSARPVHAQVQISGKLLPLELAEAAAQAAIRSCEASGYRVSASVVDVEGMERVALRGDRSAAAIQERLNALQR